MRISRYSTLGFLLVALVPLTLVLLKTSPATGAPPATQPQRSAGDSLRTWYAQLADRDPQVRELARIELMGIGRNQLDQLEKVVAENRPVQASQAAVLQDIVMHVYMAGEPYPVAQTWGGFLGLRWEHGERDVWADPPGVIVSQRIPGFVAFRMLRQGDVIVGIEQMPEHQFRKRDDLPNLLRRIDAGTTLDFLVLRGGDIQKVPIKLDPRPAVARLGEPPDRMATLESDRHSKFEAYWSRAFAPLLEEPSVSSIPPE